MKTVDKGTSVRISAAVVEQLRFIASQRGVSIAAVIRLGAYLAMLQHSTADERGFSYFLRLAETHEQFLIDRLQFGQEAAEDIARGKAGELARQFPGMASRLAGKEQPVVRPVALAVEKATAQN